MVVRVPRGFRNDHLVLEAREIRQLLHSLRICPGDTRSRGVGEGTSSAGRDHRPGDVEQRGDALARCLHQLVEIDVVMRRLLDRFDDLRHQA